MNQNSITPPAKMIGWGIKWIINIGWNRLRVEMPFTWVCPNQLLKGNGIRCIVNLEIFPEIAGG